MLMEVKKDNSYYAVFIGGTKPQPLLGKKNHADGLSSSLSSYFYFTFNFIFNFRKMSYLF